MNDFLDNLGAQQYEKYFANHRMHKKGVKITPETYEKMNEEFEKEGLSFKLSIPTQKEIDEWKNQSGVKQQTK